MYPRIYVAVVCALVLAGAVLSQSKRVSAGESPIVYGYKVLAPIRQGNLTIFPVVTSKTHSTDAFLTLDEGVRTGDVVVSESGRIAPLIRRRDHRRYGEQPLQPGGAQVNTLVLVNNSKRPLLLLAGEIVTGGKQDRVIGRDRLIPAESDPVDLGVFCVEPGRWVGAKSEFSTMGFSMAAPGVRSKAMAEKNQAQVWSAVRGAQESIVAAAPPPVGRELQATTSYAQVIENKDVQRQLNAVAAPIESGYRSLIKELKDRNAVGVVVAVNGEIIWADLFASTDLLQRYWPKLVRSYAAEAIVTRAKSAQADEKAAQAFLEKLEGRHETVESEPGLYRHTEISGDGFKAFELTSLLPKTGFDLHLAKMAE
jgi:hypothetical protein